MRYATALRRIVVSCVLVSFCAAAATWSLADEPRTAGQYRADPSQLLEGYRHVEVASVSDAIEQLLHKKQYMSHRMTALFPTKFAGVAITVKLSKAEGAGSAALNGMLDAIDTGGPGSVYVMEVDDGADIAGMGGLMGTAMSARGYAGAVVDGGVRDVAQLKRIQFPVYALGPVPSTSVAHYRFAGANIDIRCDGVDVQPGDIIAADQDGVVVVPKANAPEILVRAQELDNSEHSMYPYIEKYHSIVEAVKKFGRI